MASSAAPEPLTNITDGTSGHATGPTAHFIFIEPKPEGKKQAPLIEAWNRAISLYFTNTENPPFTVLEGTLQKLDAAVLECDCMVSPANSFGIMDGGYDDVLSNAFRGPANDYWALTNQAQEYIKREWNGYLPPGSCVIVPLPTELAGPNNPWKARFIAMLPTMRVPESMAWHRDIVYHCMWSLQVAIKNWNRNHPEGRPIERVLMTGLATGYGEIPAEKCAGQMVLAVHHFRQPVQERLRWAAIVPRENEIVDTINLDVNNGYC
ncbi:hypothetical protein M408DRAFT_66006 [Serendipita vermifera MAFF 305830]|uniref:Macro-like domain-containing protein n=1 Tax=Serendipita vermifera MAFF 305830 TaxID=933852 RepID=A0A0C3B1I9_SERVB|nr:hypothetical protein M408DRAFT_66006 [Serendipita vermifera MAFF 305830]